MSRDGRRVRDGYIDLYLPDHPAARRDGYVAEHRAIAWDAGLLRDPAAHVHHRNGDKQDNRLENLEVLSATEHTLRHLEESGMVRNGRGTWPVGSGFARRHRAWAAELGERHCPECGALMLTQRLDATYCSSRCRIRVWKRQRRLALKSV